MKSMGDRIRALREAHSLSIVECAKATGLSRSCIGNLELGVVTDHKLNVVTKLADFFKVSIDYLVHGHQPKTSGRHQTLTSQFQNLHNDDQDIVMALIIRLLRKSK